MKLASAILSLLLSGCAVVTYDRPPVHVTVIHFAEDAKADRGFVRLPDGAVLFLSGASTNPNAQTVQILAAAVIRGLMLIP